MTVMSISVNTAPLYHLWHSQNSHLNTTVVSHLDEFEKIVRKNPKVLYPAFHTQDAVRKAILGLKYWKRATKKRKLEFADRDRYFKYFSLYLNRYLLNGDYFWIRQRDKSSLQVLYDIITTKERARKELEAQGIAKNKKEKRKRHDEKVQQDMENAKRVDYI